MKTEKISIMVILFVSVFTMAQAQQSEFQGTWVGEKSERLDRSAYRLEITRNKWQQFYNNEIDAAGTVRFSAGRAELLLADGRLFRNLRLLAPGLIEQPISWSDGYYRFRRVQSSSNSVSNLTAQDFLESGNKFFVNGEYDRAITDYNQAIRLDPNYADVYNNRGMAYEMEGYYDRAIADYNYAIRLNPNYADAYFCRGNAYSNKKDYDHAIADFNQTIRLDPNRSFTYYFRGNVYADKGDYDLAIADYNQAIRLDPNYALAYNNRGSAYEEKGNKQ